MSTAKFPHYCSLTQLHCRFEISTSELDHDRISVTVNDFSVVLEPLGHREFCLDSLLGGLNHLSSVSCSTGRDSQTRQFSDCCTSETIHRVRRDLGCREDRQCQGVALNVKDACCLPSEPAVDRPRPLV